MFLILLFFEFILIKCGSCVFDHVHEFRFNAIRAENARNKHNKYKFIEYNRTKQLFLWLYPLKYPIKHFVLFSKLN